MPKLVYGMTQTTEQEKSDVQRVIEASIAQEMDERAQKKLEMAHINHAIEETSATAAIAPTNHDLHQVDYRPRRPQTLQVQV